jgi:predicted DNA-binding transcriptional regulator YafY
MRASRLISLLLLLQMRGQATAAELAGHFGVSVRTVHRDVESLTNAGVPVEAVRGPGGGYRLSGGYRTKLTGLTADEAEALFVAPGPAAELGLGGVLANARMKVLAALPEELQERVSRAERFFHLDTRRWFRSEDTVPHLAALATATWQGRRVDARYREGGRVVRRRLDPLGLVLKGGAWYLVARRRGEFRVYRVSRFASVRPREDGFERPEGFDLATYWNDWSTTFEASLRRVEVTLRVSDRARRDLPEHMHVENGLWRVGFETLDHAFRELIRYGADVEVVDPPELRTRIAATASELATLYDVQTMR